MHDESTAKMIVTGVIALVVLISAFLIYHFVYIPAKERKERVRQETRATVYADNELSIREIGGCQYVVFAAYNKGGIVHHAACKNEIHKK